MSGFQECPGAWRRVWLLDKSPSIHAIKSNLKKPHLFGIPLTSLTTGMRLMQIPTSYRCPLNGLARATEQPNAKKEESNDYDWCLHLIIASYPQGTHSEHRFTWSRWQAQSHVPKHRRLCSSRRRMSTYADISRHSEEKRRQGWWSLHEIQLPGLGCWTGTPCCRTRYQGLICRQVVHANTPGRPCKTFINQTLMNTLCALGLHLTLSHFSVGRKWKK